jgi:hypothetical protein
MQNNVCPETLVFAIHVAVKWDNTLLSHDDTYNVMLRVLKTHTAQQGSDVIE